MIPESDLEALFRAERRRPDPGAAARARVLSRVEATVALAPPAAPHAPPSPGAGWLHRVLAGRAVVAVVCLGSGAVLGAFGHAVVSATTTPRHEPVAAVDSTAAQEPASPAPSSSPALAPWVNVAPTPPEPRDHDPAPTAHRTPTVAPPAARPTSPVASTAARDLDLTRERSLLELARGAIARGQPRDALDALDEHAVQFPKGRLAEEREALAVQALVQASRMPEARARAARFEARFPSSILLPAVLAVVGTNP